MRVMMAVELLLEIVPLIHFGDNLNKKRGDFEVAQANPCLFSGLPTYLVCSLMHAFDVMSAFGVPF